MKTYRVYFHIKANNDMYSNMLQIDANTSKEAKEKCSELVWKKTGKHAFHVATKSHEDYGKAKEWPITLQ